MAERQVPDRGQGSAQAEAAEGRRAQRLNGLTGPAARALAAALLLFGPAAASALHGQDLRPPIAELVAALQAKYDAVRDFSAAFEQTYTGGVLRATLMESGTVLIKKPGRMRWHYTAPEEKLFVSDGVSLYSYLPADRQVIVGEVPAGGAASTAVLFLAGRGSLARDFVAAWNERIDAPAHTWAVELTPVRDDVDYSRLTLVVDRESLSLVQLRATDFQNAVSAFTFSDMQENRALPDALFDFEVPSGVEVIAGGDLLR